MLNEVIMIIIIMYYSRSYVDIICLRFFSQPAGVIIMLVSLYLVRENTDLLR